MQTAHPIPETLVQAFRTTAGEFREWRKYGGPEPQIVLDGQSHSIGWIAELAAHFDDPCRRTYLIFLS